MAEKYSGTVRHRYRCTYVEMGRVVRSSCGETKRRMVSKWTQNSETAKQNVSGRGKGNVRTMGVKNENRDDLIGGKL